MKLKKWIKAVDPLIDVVIWTQDDNESPSFEGSMFDIPSRFLNYKIGRADKKNEDEPIYIAEYTNKHNVKLPVVVINLIK